MWHALPRILLLLVSRPYEHGFGSIDKAFLLSFFFSSFFCISFFLFGCWQYVDLVWHAIIIICRQR